MRQTQRERERERQEEEELIKFVVSLLNLFIFSSHRRRDFITLLSLLFILFSIPTSSPSLSFALSLSAVPLTRTLRRCLKFCRLKSRTQNNQETKIILGANLSKRLYYCKLFKIFFNNHDNFAKKTKRKKRRRRRKKERRNKMEKKKNSALIKRNI